MTIKWTNTRTDDPRPLRILLHGESGAGKTHLARTVPDPSRCLLAMVEDGALSLADVDMPAARILRSADLDEVCKVLASSKGKAIDWLYVDSITAWAEMILHEELAATPDPRRAYGGMQDRVKRWLAGTMATMPQHVVCTAKQERIQSDTNKRTMHVPNMPGQTLTHKSPIAHDFDAVWCLQVREDSDGTAQRWIQTQLAADPGNLAKTRDPWGRVQPWESPDLAAIAAKLCTHPQQESA